jgi:hypothetical protein
MCLYLQAGSLAERLFDSALDPVSAAGGPSFTPEALANCFYQKKIIVSMRPLGDSSKQQGTGYASDQGTR